RQNPALPRPADRKTGGRIGTDEGEERRDEQRIAEQEEHVTDRRKRHLHAEEQLVEAEARLGEGEAQQAGEEKEPAEARRVARLETAGVPPGVQSSEKHERKLPQGAHPFEGRLAQRRGQQHRGAGHDRGEDQRRPPAPGHGTSCNPSIARRMVSTTVCALSFPMKTISPSPSLPSRASTWARLIAPPLIPRSRQCALAAVRAISF